MADNDPVFVDIESGKGIAVRDRDRITVISAVIVDIDHDFVSGAQAGRGYGVIAAGGGIGIVADPIDNQPYRGAGGYLGRALI